MATLTPSGPATTRTGRHDDRDRDAQDRLSEKLSAGLLDLTALKTAVFGNPLDQHDEGMVGSLREIHKMISAQGEAASSRMERWYVMLVGLLGTVLVAAIGLLVALS